MSDLRKVFQTGKSTINKTKQNGIKWLVEEVGTLYKESGIGFTHLSKYYRPVMMISIQQCHL